MGRHLLLAAPVSTTDGGPLSITTPFVNTGSPIGTDETTDDYFTRETNRTTTSDIDDGISESIGATQEDAASGEPSSDEDDLTSEPELSFDSPREQQHSTDRRCISAKLVEQIQNDMELRNLAANTSICGWRYEYDVNPRRVPEVLVKAVCNDTPASIPGNERCDPVHYPIPVKKLDENNNWVSCTESIVVGCVLARTGPIRPGINPTPGNPSAGERTGGQNPFAPTPAHHNKNTLIEDI